MRAGIYIFWQKYEYLHLGNILLLINLIFLGRRFDIFMGAGIFLWEQQEGKKRLIAARRMWLAHLYFNLFILKYLEYLEHIQYIEYLAHLEDQESLKYLER